MLMGRICLEPGFVGTSSVGFATCVYVGMAHMASLELFLFRDQNEKEKENVYFAQVLKHHDY